MGSRPQPTRPYILVFSFLALAFVLVSSAFTFTLVSSVEVAGVVTLDSDVAGAAVAGEVVVAGAVVAGVVVVAGDVVAGVIEPEVVAGAGVPCTGVPWANTEPELITSVSRAAENRSFFMERKFD